MGKEARFNHDRQGAIGHRGEVVGHLPLQAPLPRPPSSPSGGWVTVIAVSTAAM